MPSLAKITVTAAIIFIAAISHACSANPSPSDEIKRWSFEKDAAGWKAQNHCELRPKDGGVLLVNVTGGDPYMSASVDGPAGWKQLSFRAKIRARFDGQLFWVTKKDPATAEARSVKFYVRGNGKDFLNYRVYFKPDSELTSIRFDLHSRKGPTEFEWIALKNGEPPKAVATTVDKLKLLPGFEAELLYSVPIEDQGSWVSMTVDHKGRLITSDQYGKLYRVTPPAIGSQDECEIEPIEVELGMAQGLLYAFDSLYVVVNGEGPGLYRVRDTDGDDKFDDVQLLREIRGASEHGPHAVILGPDKKSLYVCGGNHTEIPDPETSRVPRVWDEDHLLGRQWDAGGHAVGKMAPGGWICRTDPDGKKWELVSTGYRNEYDIAFNSEGELFTYDADMEWDVGLPWYRPTRVNHATSGSEFGWRSGTGKWPAYYPDSLPAVVNIGPGSPTGIAFGYGTKFPAKYQQALYIIDWSYGVIYAVHMSPEGSSYVGTAEPFISGAPLNGTDIVVNPKDGALYFTIGGRRTQSGLYRVTYVGKESVETFRGRDALGAELRTIRRDLEKLHKEIGPKAVETAWERLSHEDRFIRFAARIAIEHQPVATWQDRVFAEKDPHALITAAIALARHGDEKLQFKLIDQLCSLDWSKLDESQRLDLLRAMGLTFIRMGESSVGAREAAMTYLNYEFPARSQSLNRELAQVLIYLEAPEIVQRTVKLLENAPTQEEQIHYALSLRNLKSGWTLADRERYFNWFLVAAGHRGGHSFGGFLANIRKEAVASLSEKERESLKELLARQPISEEPADTTPRKFVKKWSVAELMPRLDAGLSGRDFENGRRMFAAAQCFKCHRFDGRGGIVGPDLTAVARRYNNQTMLESLIEPSKVISDQFQAMTFILDDGRTITGRIVNLSGKSLRVSTNMLDPGKLTPVNTDEIEESFLSRTSQMPDGLLDTLTEQEVLDLLAYLQSGGDGKHDAFQK